MAIGEEDLQLIVQLHEMRDEVEQAIECSRSRLAAIQKEIAEVENRFHELVRPTQTLRVFQWQDRYIVVHWTEAGVTIELRKSGPLERRPGDQQ